MKKARKLAPLILFALLQLVGFLAFSKTVFLTDLEGRFEPINQLITDGTFVVRSDGTLDFSDSETKLVFGGDLMDRGPHTIRLMRYLIHLKNTYPDRVHLIWGNRDLNKLSFSVDLEQKMVSLQDSKYREFLQSKLEMIQTVKSGATLESINTPENQVQWWAEQYGLSKAIEFHQQELRELRKVEITYSEAARDFADMISNPKREYLTYLKLGQLVHSEGPVVYVHGGLPSQNGFVPDSAKIYQNFSDWEKALNSWGKRQISEFVEGVSQANVGDKGNKLVFYGDALYDSNLKKVWNHDNSVVYGPRFKEDSNFRLPAESTSNWLKENGKTMMVLGHSPAGNIPTPLRGQDLLVVMADTSYSPNGGYTKISIDGDKLEVAGKMENGTQIRYQTSPNDKKSPIGMQFGAETVVGLTTGEKVVLFKYSGYEISERIVDQSYLATGALKMPIYEQNAVNEDQKRELLNALSQRGARVVELSTFKSELLNGRMPVLFAGSSAYADASQETVVRDMVIEALKNLDPAKVVILTGATDKGPEKIVHEIATKLGFQIHGLVVSAAVPQEVSSKISSFSWVGHDWAAQPKAAMDFIKSTHGFGIIMGGGGLLQSGLEYGRSIGASFTVASNVKHGNGAVSASMNFSTQQKQNSFESGKSLARLLKRYYYRATKKKVVEATAEQAITALHGRGKSVVTLIGFPGAGYENQDALLESLKLELGALDPKKTIINIGGTPDGIGIAYEVAKQMGFETAGIVSTKAQRDWLSSFCDRTYMIKDTTWGGFINGTKALSPTSRAMIGVSDIVIAIGGGAVGRDEYIAAKEKGLSVKFIAAEMNHQKAISKAMKAGKPAPTEFRGELELAIPQSEKLSSNSAKSTLIQQLRSKPSGAVGGRCADIFL